MAKKRTRSDKGALRKDFSHINWALVDQFIGVIPDGEIEKEFGIKRESVGYRRRKRFKLPPVKSNKINPTRFKQTIEWDKIIPHLGVVSDSKIAKEFRVSVGSVCLKRKSLGIKPVYEWHSKGREMEEWHKERIRLSSKGNKYSLGRKQSPQEIKKRVMSMQGVTTRCKFYQTSAGLVQGTYELRYIQGLEVNGEPIPKKCTVPIKTPYGIYLPDFEYEDRFVEIKSDYTFDICIGRKHWGKTSNNKRIPQINRINYVRDFIKPVQIIILEKK